MRKAPVIALVGVAEDMRADLETYLRRVGYDLRKVAQHWEEQLPILPDDTSIAIVGAGIPTSTANDLLRQHSAKGVDFLMICEPTELVERVIMLESGAADVVENPVLAREVAARVSQLAARRGFSTRETVVLERSSVDLRAALVMKRNGDEEQLSAGQVALLKLFLANPHRVMTREDIIAAAPAERDDAFDRSIDSRIVRLRRKLDTDSISTIRGNGYRFDPPQ